MNQRPFSSSIYSEESAPSSPESREHLSLTVPPPVPAVEHSRFSPITPSEHASPLGQQVFRRSFPRSRRPDPEKGPTSHSNSSSQSLQPGIRNSLARLSAILRVSRRGDSSVQRFTPNEVASPSEMSAWRLDHARESDSHHALYVYPRPTRTQERYTPALLFAFTIFLLYLFINVVVLNARSFSSSHSSPRLLPTTPTANASTSAPASAPTTTMMVSADTQQCLTQFTLNATNDPKGYPCSTCLPLLLALPTSANSLYPVAWDATQFCGLRSIWEDASQQGRTGLEAGGWVNDVQFCTWSGVRCNNAGRVSSLILTSPAIPASLPAQFTSLTELETMEVVGNGSTPAGLFPTDFGALTNLRTLHLESTALSALPDTLQHLTSLILVRNTQVGLSLPPSLESGTLLSLIVNNEPLTLSAAQSAALCNGQLLSCDLRGTGIKACGACSVS